jgi:N-acetylglutamate synthase-like GNAT family acetyltransferase
MIAYKVWNGCEVVAPGIQDFRSRIYMEDGVVTDEAYRSIDFNQSTKHVVAINDDILNGRIVGCARLVMDKNIAICSGVAVSKEKRSGIIWYRMMQKIMELAKKSGAKELHGYSTERNSTAEMLERLGGRVEKVCFDEKYNCKMTLIVFVL